MTLLMILVASFYCGYTYLRFRDTNEYAHMFCGQIVLYLASVLYGMIGTVEATVRHM